MVGVFNVWKWCPVQGFAASRSTEPNADRISIVGSGTFVRLVVAPICPLPHERHLPEWRHPVGARSSGTVLPQPIPKYDRALCHGPDGKRNLCVPCGVTRRPRTADEHDVGGGFAKRDIRGNADAAGGRLPIV